jgi:hypothetical protein
MCFCWKLVVVEVMKKRGDFCNRETRPGLQALMQEEYEAALATSVAIFVAKDKEGRERMVAVGRN